MKIHSAKTAGGPELGFFRPIKKFNYIEVEGPDEVPILKAVYLPKFTYTIRDQKLLAKARQWKSDGLVVLQES